MNKKVKFHTEQNLPERASLYEKRSFLIESVIAYSGGLITTKKQAEKFLLFVALVFFALAGYFFISSAPPEPPPLPVIEE